MLWNDAPPPPPPVWNISVKGSYWSAITSVLIGGWESYIQDRGNDSPILWSLLDLYSPHAQSPAPFWGDMHTLHSIPHKCVSTCQHSDDNKYTSTLIDFDFDFSLNHNQILLKHFYANTHKWQLTCPWLSHTTPVLESSSPPQWETCSPQWCHSLVVEEQEHTHTVSNSDSGHGKLEHQSGQCMNIGGNSSL